MSQISDQLIKHEGLRLFVYYDSLGIPTIGVGRNLKDRGISKNEAMMMLDNDIDDFTLQLSERLYWFDMQPDNAKLVLIDMAFNMGIGGLLTFHKTLEYFKNNDYKNAAIEMKNSHWYNEVPNRADDLINILNSI
jgi:lysozyme